MDTIKTGPRYIGEVNYASIVAHVEKLGITDLYKIKMNPVDFEKLILEYEKKFQKDFRTVLLIAGIPVEQLEATPVNRICVVHNNPDGDSCTI
ncbi:hypothetical protein [Cytophaga hutchinsonii]|jgi:hypothetical protein|uniref:Uncharacterized protein n=1 Tax=Cytophaga hutchinsonii (strain ATCC 33406 / DSM 1761 / CIP 103989 / NBRC 15051 / NCIMB 9469 / D465) TaxID=269798 RepID=A0A6N4SSV4_CYTH3|nr:hypothetical protein [Cytophaga hutchinsonii]ABG59409.1 hypothetical protein CHU_2146 [Cytophaga hutchinsonii ATCC 33406]SFX93203.1 hypothetical protein SAMN04487930_113100 [Cytophaga hutchinsonii ATCC 33406]